MMIGNEGRRTVVQGAIAKSMGLLPGASDLLIARCCGPYAGLFMEVKQAREYSDSEKRTEHWLRQEAFQARMRAAGYATCFAFGCGHGITLITHYLAKGIRELQVSPPVIPPDRVVE